MTVSREIIDAAQELGAALNADPVVQEFLQAREALQNNQELHQLEEQIEKVYQGLVGRQRSGEVLAPREINDFYLLRDQYTLNPLVKRYEECQNAVQVLFGQAGSAISSILSIDYTKMILE